MCAAQALWLGRLARVLSLGIAAGGGIAMPACGGEKGVKTEPAAKVTALSDALRPDFYAKAMKKIGGAHYRGTTRFSVGAPGQPANAVTTTTDVWVDRTGNYHVKEENDRDGGREVVLHGRELAVALRYGEMMRRIAEEPEPSRLLEEALGGPWAAFELMAPRARVARAGNELVGGVKATVFQLSLGDGGKSGAKSGERAAVGSAPLVANRAWRKTAVVDKLSGRVVVDDATGALLKADLTATFNASGESGPVQGSIEVHGALTEVAATPPVERPLAEELSLRQRTLPEQKELLRGLGVARTAAEPTRPGAQKRP